MIPGGNPNAPATRPGHSRVTVWSRSVASKPVNQLKIFTLGALRIRVDGESLDLGTPKQRALLALLVINRRRTVAADRIIIALWGPDAPPQRRKDVWVYISRLRKSLGPVGEALRREPGGYVLDIDDAVVDSVAFEALVEEGRRLLPDDPAAASLVLGEALAAWSGSAYEEVATNDFAAAEIARLEEYRLLALETRIQADLAWRETDQLIPEIEGLAQAHPLRSDLTASLMIALYRRGRQVDALRAYDRYTKRLADETGLQPPEDLKILEEQILLDNPVVNPSNRTVRTGLPEPIASFVGREAELSEVSDLLMDHRLVTLTGPGGVGKSATAIEVARRLALNHDDVALVDLTRSEQSVEIMTVVAEALHVRVVAPDAVNQILDRLGSRKVLLIFDNCEPVAAKAAETIVMLLRGTPHLTVLATSRVVLEIQGEQIVRLAPMSTEHDGDAAQLLGTRIAALPSTVREAIGDDEFHALCVKTGGLPLSIELAAAQLGAWSAQEVIDALDQPLETLVVSDRVGPEHHSEMRASVAWSERLLPPLSQRLLARLSVFRSSFTFDAVSAVAGFEPLTDRSVRHEFRRLVDASTVIAQPGTPARYHLLEPVRQYAAIRLEDVGEASAMATRHLTYFADLFETLDHLIDSGTEAGALARARPDDANLHAAIWWAVGEGQADTAQRLASSAIPFWRATVSISDILPTIDAALGVSDSPSRARAELLFRSMPFYILSQGADAAMARLEDLDSTANDLSDPEVTAWLLLRRADATAGGGNSDQVVEMYSRAVESLRASGSRFALSALHQLGWYQYWCWDRWAETEVTVAIWHQTEESLDLPSPEPAVLNGWLALAQRNHEVAERIFGTVSTEFRRRADYRMASLQMLPLAINSLQRGEVAEAARRIDVAVAASRESGAIPWLQNTLMTRSYVRIALDDHRGAIADLLEAAATIGEGDESPVAASLALSAANAVGTSLPERAATLLGAAESLRYGHNMLRLVLLLVAPTMTELNGGTEPLVRDAIPAGSFDSAWKHGALLDAATTTALAIEALAEASRAFD